MFFAARPILASLCTDSSRAIFPTHNRQHALVAGELTRTERTQFGHDLATNAHTAPHPLSSQLPAPPAPTGGASPFSVPPFPASNTPGLRETVPAGRAG